jgi:ATP phosphoribosyltransferase
MVVAGVVGRPRPAGVPRVATKYPRCASEHFAKRGVQAEIVYVAGSVELAPLVGLVDLVVDLVETGETLARNGLEEVDEIAKLSSVLVANRAAFKLRHDRVKAFVDGLRAAVTPRPEGQGGRAAPAAAGA